MMVKIQVAPMPVDDTVWRHKGNKGRVFRVKRGLPPPEGHQAEGGKGGEGQE